MSSTTRNKSFIPKSVKKNVPTTQRGASNRKDAHGELKPSKNKPNAGNKVSKTTHGATSNTVEEKKKGTANEGSKSDSEGFSDGIPHLYTEDNSNTINILLLGETGVGKSTFINSFANYVNSKTFDEAKNKKIVVLIPTQVTVYDANGKMKTITVGKDDNEEQQVGSSATQSVKTYVFPANHRYIRLIDTPGLGDTEGVEKDDQHCEEILAYLDQLNHINAICLLMKPSNERNTVFFQYCVQRILSQFHKSACKNVVFLFTNTKGSDYTPGSTLPILLDLTTKITENISISKTNYFCLDNDPFKQLLALGHKVALSMATMKSCRTSWKFSSQEIRRFVDHVTALEPHDVRHTVSINKTRNLVLELSKPLSDIFQLLQQKIMELQKKEEESKKADLSIYELKKKLYKSTVDLETIRLKYPRLVCTNPSCPKLEKVENMTKFSHNTKCLDRCWIGKINCEKVGHWSLRFCNQIGFFNFICKHCQCSGSEHKNAYYETKIVEKQVVDESVQTTIKSEKEQREELNELIKSLVQEKEELIKEEQFISECAAKFAHFLENNVITTAYDTYREYLNLSLERERSFGSEANSKVVTNLQSALEKHDELIKFLKENKKLQDGEEITAKSIEDDTEKLFKLERMGPKIQEIVDARRKCVQNGIKANFKSVVTKEIPSWFFNKALEAVSYVQNKASELSMFDTQALPRLENGGSTIYSDCH
ncbi:hypothetical protein Zmor_012694 [Zophobas morio]|uniref:G domain-containing protein n=1 Tax=Zophobas morio TaxID=2755281 RepID=A0AA38IGD9_9CUCU|nr:hypothetical protein Zmor_012694 [Zophobas morio]